MAYARNVYQSEEHPTVVQHRQEVIVATAYLSHQLAHGQVGTNRVVILLYQVVHAHQCKGGTVNVVCKQLALPCQTQGIDGVTLKDADGKVGRNAHDHKGHEELVATCKFGYEEDAGERCVHHARHHTRHTKKRKVLFGYVNTHLVFVPQPREKEARETTDKE